MSKKQTTKPKKSTTKITGSISKKQKSDLENMGVELEVVEPKQITSETKGGKTDKDLKLQMEQFCKLFATDIEFFGNGVQSYVKAYNVDTAKKNWHNVASVCASKMLRNTKIIDRINELLEEGGFNDQNVDKQLKFLISQNADFSTKLGAIREYNKLKKRIEEKETPTESHVHIYLPDNNRDTGQK